MADRPVELFRVYPPNTETERDETPHNDSKTGLLEEKIRHLEREIRHLEQTTDDLGVQQRFLHFG
jgi:hypothetical protein